jgi:hypothetical protein
MLTAHGGSGALRQTTVATIVRAKAADVVLAAATTINAGGVIASQGTALPEAEFAMNVSSG